MPRKSWSARGSPLVRRTSPPVSAPPVPTDLVRECLLRPPQPAGLYVARPGVPESRQLRRAMAIHHLEPWDDLIAVWQWSKISGLFSVQPSSLIFTSQDIRIAEPRLRLRIAYAQFEAYTFRYDYIPGGRYDADVFQLVIDGPTPWRSPNANQDAEIIADDLIRLKALVTSARP